MVKIRYFIFFILFFGFLYASVVSVSQQTLVGEESGGSKDIINIGVIVDMGSWLGKVVESCISMAITDFYNENSQYRTRISLHVRDSRGDSLHSITAAIDLLETVEVRSLIMPVISNEQLLIASLADNANVPLLSFSAVAAVDKHPYYLQVTRDETNEFHGIAALIELFKWKECVILHEDSTGVQPNLYKILLKNNIGVTYQTPISLSATNDQIVNELWVIMSMKTSIVVVHMSPSLASKVFENANLLGMMSKGFAWIVTSKTMNLLSSQDSSDHKMMQGAIGFRSYISSSKRLQDFTKRWRREFHLSESKMETGELNVNGLIAYDAVWALAHAIERAGIKPYQSRVKCNLLDSGCSRVSDSGEALLTQISNIKVTGLAGVFEIKNKKLAHENYEIVNVIGRGERAVGYWNSVYGLTEEIYTSSNFLHRRALETIIWPGVSVTTPSSQLVQISGKRLRVGIPSFKVRPELVNWRYDQKTNVTIADGFCVEVFRAAFDWLKYDASFEFFPFNGTYNDLVDQVYLQKYDVAVGDVSILENRSVYVDFTSPFTDLGVGMVVKLDDKDPWFFTKPLDQGLWVMSAFGFVMMGIVVWFIECPINKEFQGSPVQQLGTLLSFAASTLVFAHRERLKSNISKFVVGIWLFIVLILTSSYTANLSSLLTVQRFKLTKSDYIGSANSFVQGHAVTNLRFDDYKLKPYQTANEYDVALKRGSKKGGVGAIVDEIPYIKIFLAKYPNEYTIIQTSMATSGFGFAFPKGSTFVPELSRAIAGLREKGKLLEMETKWFTRKSPILPDENEGASVSALSIRDFSHLFLLSGISEMLALLLLLVISLREWFVGIYLRFTALTAQRLRYMLGKLFPRMGIVVAPVDRNFVNMELVRI